MEDRWNELKAATVRSAEEHLQRKKKAKKFWITVETLDQVEVKKRAFSLQGGRNRCEETRRVCGIVREGL